MRRAVAAVLSAVILGTSLSMTVARADRPDSGQGNDPPPAPTPTPEPTAAPPPTTYPTPTAPPIIAPTVNAGGTIVINAPPGPGVYPPPPGPNGNVVTPAGVPIVIRNDERAEHRLLSVDGMVLGSCMGNCTFQVPPGSYIIEMRETETYRSGRKKIVVTGPTMVDVTPGSKSKRNTGLVLGSVGAGVFFVGLIGTMVVSLRNSSREFDCETGYGRCESSTSAVPYVLAMVLGAAGTVTGFVMFGTSSTKLNSTAYAPSYAFAPIKFKDGAGMGLTIRF